MSKISSINPSNIGWLSCALEPNEVDYVWKRIKEKEKSTDTLKHKLAGNISTSKKLEDPDDWFYKNVLLKCCYAYNDLYENMGKDLPVSEQNLPYYMREWWVNYQYQNEFNPQHDHTGVYSFVIWLKIPTEYDEQNKDNVSNSKLKSVFQFTYTDILGKIRCYNYYLNKSFEGDMLFFPSKLNHQVYPFYNCDDSRISVSGNILVKLSQGG